MWPAPIMSNPLDATLVAFLGVYCSLAFADALKLPLVGRRGGLFTYGKWAAGVEFGPAVPSRVGMALLYLPSAVLPCVLAVGPFAPVTLRGALVAGLLVAHFAKRTLECLLVHRYSGSMPLASSLNISASYMLTCFVFMHYAGLHPAAPLGMGPVAGVAVFVVGELGNLYHHVLLARLRGPGGGGDKVYKVPCGGLFEYVAAPHYMFEIAAFAGLAIACEHLMAAGVVAAMALYLGNRAAAQTAWNRSKFEDYPKSRKHMVPFLF